MADEALLSQVVDLQGRDVPYDKRWIQAQVQVGVLLAEWQEGVRQVNEVSPTPIRTVPMARFDGYAFLARQPMPGGDLLR